VLIVRDARPDERDAIAALTRAAYAEIWRVMTPSAWAGFSRAMESGLATDAPVERIVAEEGGRLVGSAMLYPASSNAYGDDARRVSWPEVRLVAVHPDARGRGIARALMDECIRRARASGADALGLHTSKSFRAAIAMYARMGFERAPEHDFQPPGAELVEGYRLDLGSA
jgi:ribosomal protein S18 acetylase RimI-like enzyme